MFSRRFFLACLGMLAAAPAFAAGLMVPKGRVLLTVSGAIDVTNTGDLAVFDRAMLEQLDWREIETFTSFTTGKQRFAGPTLASVLEAVKVRGGRVRATAINDYAAEFPASDADAHDVILALDHNGKPMRIRDKGPIWVVYPTDEATAKLQPFDNQMVWQLDRLIILE